MVVEEGADPGLSNVHRMATVGLDQNVRRRGIAVAAPTAADLLIGKRGLHVRKLSARVFRAN